MYSQLMVILLACLLPGIGLSAASPVASSVPLPPSQDPWYTAPQDFAAASPGQILRFRTAPGNLTAVYSNSSAAYNILFRTTNTHYEPWWGVTTVLVPRDSNGSALLSYQIPYNTAFLDGSPSYSLQSTPEALGLIYSDLQTALGRGWIVNVPDFEGPLASFAEGVQEGHAVLDAVRAVLNSRKIGTTKDVKYALWGYSGGSLASEWAAELQVQYAPELNFAGAALGGLVTNGSSTIQASNGTEFAGLVPEGLLGFTTQYPKARQYLLDQLKPEGPFNKTTFLAAEHMTIEEAFPTFAYQDMFQYFKNGQQFFEAPVIEEALNRDCVMGFHGLPQMPLFLYKAIEDELCFVNFTDSLVDRFCSVGANIVYERNTVGGHYAEEMNGDQAALDWLGRVLDGTYDHQGCTVRNVTWNVTDSPF